MTETGLEARHPEPEQPWRIPMRSANGWPRWSCKPANRWIPGFATPEDALHAAALVAEADKLVVEAGRLPAGRTRRAMRRRATQLYQQVTRLSMKGGLR